jgi:hypothetical protein
MMKNEPTSPKFLELPLLPPRADGKEDDRPSEKRLLGVHALDSGRVYEFAHKKFVSQIDGHSRDTFLIRSTSKDRTHQGEDNLSVAAAIELRNALELFFAIRRAEAIEGRHDESVSSPRDWARAVPARPALSGPQPSHLQRRKQAAEERRRAGVPRGSTMPK